MTKLACKSCGGEGYESSEDGFSGPACLVCKGSGIDIAPNMRAGLDHIIEHTRDRCDCGDSYHGIATSAININHATES